MLEIKNDGFRSAGLDPAEGETAIITLPSAINNKEAFKNLYRKELTYEFLS